MATTAIALFRPARRVSAGALALLRAWRQRVVSRRELARLDAHLLRDIGLDRAQAMHEAQKPFWRR